MEEEESFITDISNEKSLMDMVLTPKEMHKRVGDLQIQDQNYFSLGVDSVEAKGYEVQRTAKSERLLPDDDSDEDYNEISAPYYRIN